MENFKNHNSKLTRFQNYKIYKKKRYVYQESGYYHANN